MPARCRYCHGRRRLGRRRQAFTRPDISRQGVECQGTLTDDYLDAEGLKRIIDSNGWFSVGHQGGKIFQRRDADEGGMAELVLIGNQD